jgi:hypothetical protein
VESFATWLDGTAFSTALKDNFWVVPTIQSIHILAICLVLTSAVIVSLRAWNLIGADWTPHQWARRLYPPHWWGLLVLLVTGVLQALAEPTRDLPNPAFQLKMLLVLIAVPIALWMTRQFYAEGSATNTAEAASSSGLALAANQTTIMVRAASLVILILWLAIIFLGRWIAYI